MIAGSVGVNGEKRSQSLKPGEKQRSIDLQQPMLKMTRSTPPIAPARSLADLNGTHALKHQHHTSANRISVLAGLYSACMDCRVCLCRARYIGCPAAESTSNCQHHVLGTSAWSKVCQGFRCE